MNAVIEECACLRCGWRWFPKKPGRPEQCPADGCRSPYWDTKPMPLKKLYKLREEWGKQGRAKQLEGGRKT